MSTPSSLGPYRVVQRLGEGGMGTVYLAIDESLDRKVAIKCLRLDRTTSASAQGSVRKRFMREARATASLNHPHVVTIHSVHDLSATHVNTPPFLVMEFLNRGSLADELVAKGAMGWREAATALRDALRGIAAAHEVGLIHRDLKPGNLMRAADGRVKVVDFGLAFSAVFDDGQLTLPGAFVGSPSYAAPEQIRGLSDVDGRADLYALAMTTFALLTGRPPFVAEAYDEILRMHLERAFPDVGALAEVPVGLVAVLTRAASKGARERYGSAEEMLGAVEAVLGDAGAMSVPQRIAVAESVEELRSRLVEATRVGDSQTRLEALSKLFGVYTKLNMHEQAEQVFREALVVHVKMHTPPPETP